jgi:hypothetical protein
VPSRFWRASGNALLPGRNVLGPAGGAALTLNPSDKDSGVTLSGGNLIADIIGNPSNCRATAAKTTGKWYFEALAANGTNALNNLGVGVANASAVLNAFMGTNSVGYYSSGFVGAPSGGGVINNPFTVADVIGVAIDADNGKIFFALNNTWQNSSNPATNTGGLSAALGSFYPTVGGGDGKWTARFTAASQSFSPPSGFTAIG